MGRSWQLFEAPRFVKKWSDIMRKEEMSLRQLEQRETVASLLTDANWQPTASNRLFDKGEHARAEAYMTFQNESFELGCKAAYIPFQSAGRLFRYVPVY